MMAALAPSVTSSVNQEKKGRRKAIAACVLLGQNLVYWRLLSARLMLIVFLMG